MNIERPAIIAVLALSAVACAPDRGKQVKSAETQLTSAQQKARAAEAELTEKQTREQREAQQRGASVEDQAKLHAEQQKERAETTAASREDISKAEKDLAGARAAMQNEREKVEAKAKERLAKIDADASYARKHGVKVSANKRAKYNADVNAFATKRAEVESRISELSRVSDTDWKAAKETLDKSIDELEDISKRLHKDM